MFPEGSMAGYSWDQDPKRFAFTTARYKFVAKMVEGKDKVLEVGCNDGFFSRIVRQHVNHLVGMDNNPIAIDLAKQMNSEKWNIYFQQWSIMDSTVLSQPGFDAVYCLDVFEHIKDEDTLLRNLAFFSDMCIIGTPSLESQAYASPVSKAAHVNCVTKSQLRQKMKKYWKHVIMFGMNDETLTTGFDPMCQYLFGIGFK
jgi:2-polyprenyl-3-methyl-5-hydroxy-6-metoxy-1,4-benzoquinol methylase